MIIRSATIADLETFREIDEAVFRAKDVWNASLTEGMLRNKGVRVLLAMAPIEGQDVEGIAVGFVVVERGGKIMKLGVLSGYRRRGAGKKKKKPVATYSMKPWPSWQDIFGRVTSVLLCTLIRQI